MAEINAWDRSYDRSGAGVLVERPGTDLARHVSGNEFVFILCSCVWFWIARLQGP